MAALLDPLRNTLDHLALDPKAKEDRRYLVSMLRRLGYSDKEIEAVLGWEGDGPRVIEVEYEPPGSQPGPGSFRVIDAWEPEERVAPATTVGFSVARDQGDAARAHGWVNADDPAVAHGWMPDTVEFQEQGAEGTADDAWPAWPDEAEAATEGEEAAPEDEWQDASADTAWPEPVQETEQAGSWQVVEDDEAWPADEMTQSVEDHQPLAQTSSDDTWAETSEDATWTEAGTEETWADAPSDDTWTETPSDDTWADAQGERPWTEDDGATGAADDTRAEPSLQEAPDAWSSDETWEASWDDVPAEPPVEDWTDGVTDVSNDYAIKDAPAGAWSPSDADTFTYDGYTLHTRMVELSTGRQQRIFFFAKNSPKSGEPCALPPGYIVETNDRTGLPFLRRDPDAEQVDVTDWETEQTDAADEESQESCLAITQAGNQCRRGPRDGSKYCATHKGWRGPRVG